MQSRRLYEDDPATGLIACEGCADLACVPVPGADPACTACGGEWSADPITGMAYCPYCEAVSSRKARAAIERRKARREEDHMAEAQHAQLAIAFGRGREVAP